MSSKKKIAIAVVITAILTFVLTVAVSGVIILFALRDVDNGFWTKLTAIEEIIRARYLYDYDESLLRDSALTAYVDALDEPYTEYFTASEYSSYTDEMRDGYVGIGIIVSVNDDNQIEVIAPYEDSPAFEAGIEAGDILIRVDGQDYNGDTLNEAVNSIRGGKAGTTVGLTLIKADGSEADVTVERRDISAESVKDEMLDGSIGYIRITRFNDKSEDGTHSTATEFKSSVEKLTGEGMEKLIIDLRDNPGGELHSVCSIADMLLGEGTILYTEDKYGEGETYSSDAEQIDIPIAVIVNGNSASASEVLTGALKDHSRATIIGEKTYGKGIVQEVYGLPDGSGISLTTEKYYTPGGVCIHDVGIEPDITVSPAEKYKDAFASTIPHEEDEQLKKAVEVIKEK